MGNFLDKPVVEKDGGCGDGPQGSSYAWASMQGWRVHMEVSAPMANRRVARGESPRLAAHLAPLSALTGCPRGGAMG